MARNNVVIDSDSGEDQSAEMDGTRRSSNSRPVRSTRGRNPSDRPELEEQLKPTPNPLVPTKKRVTLRLGPAPSSTTPSATDGASQDQPTFDASVHKEALAKLCVDPPLSGKLSTVGASTTQGEKPASQQTISDFFKSKPKPAQPQQVPRLISTVEPTSHRPASQPMPIPTDELSPPIRSRPTPRPIYGRTVHPSDNEVEFSPFTASAHRPRPFSPFEVPDPHYSRPSQRSHEAISYDDSFDADLIESQHKLVDSSGNLMTPKTYRRSREQARAMASRMEDEDPELSPDEEDRVIRDRLQTRGNNYSAMNSSGEPRNTPFSNPPSSRVKKSSTKEREQLESSKKARNEEYMVLDAHRETRHPIHPPTFIHKEQRATSLSKRVRDNSPDKSAGSYKQARTSSPYDNHNNRVPQAYGSDAELESDDNPYHGVISRTKRSFHVYLFTQNPFPTRELGFETIEPMLFEQLATARAQGEISGHTSFTPRKLMAVIFDSAATVRGAHKTSVRPLVVSHFISTSTSRINAKGQSTVVPLPNIRQHMAEQATAVLTRPGGFFSDMGMFEHEKKWYMNQYNHAIIQDAINVTFFHGRHILAVNPGALVLQTRIVNEALAYILTLIQHGLQEHIGRGAVPPHETPLGAGPHNEIFEQMLYGIVTTQKDPIHGPRLRESQLAWAETGRALLPASQIRVDAAPGSRNHGLTLGPVSPPAGHKGSSESSPGPSSNQPPPRPPQRQASHIVETHPARRGFRP